MTALHAITTANLGALPGVRHGFFTRRGGVSGGLYDGLNCGFGSDDDATAVAENRRRIEADMQAHHGPLTVHQVHGTTVAAVAGPWPEDGPPRADALVTATPGLAIGVLAADCTPVLLADPAAGVVAAAHAGWKGALAGVTDAALAAMADLGAEAGRVHAAVGPCIAQASYEVGAELRDRFLEHDAENAAFFAAGARAAHFQFDLEGYVAARLHAAGVGSLECVHRDTYAEDGLFYSYRRATHRGEGDYGRGLSAIMLAP